MNNIELTFAILFGYQDLAAQGCVAAIMNSKVLEVINYLFLVEHRSMI